jgi:hypothetical protein
MVFQGDHLMKLREWMDRECISLAEMGVRIQRTAEAVRRYAAGERIPDRDTMPKIVRVTGGEVTANDFFDIDLISESVNIPDSVQCSTGQNNILPGRSIAPAPLAQPKPGSETGGLRSSVEAHPCNPRESNVSAIGRMKRAVRAAVSVCGGVDGAAATAERSRSTAGDWNNLNHTAFPPIDCALALDEIAVSRGGLPPIACALARELGGLFVPHIDCLADEGTGPGLVMQLAAQLGEVSGLTGRAIANDGVIDAIEAEAILKGLDEHDRVSRQYRHVLESIRDGGRE